MEMRWKKNHFAHTRRTAPCVMCEWKRQCTSKKSVQINHFWAMLAELNTSKRNKSSTVSLEYLRMIAQTLLSTCSSSTRPETVPIFVAFECCSHSDRNGCWLFPSILFRRKAKVFSDYGEWPNLLPSAWNATSTKRKFVRRTIFATTTTTTKTRHQYVYVVRCRSMNND